MTAFTLRLDDRLSRQLELICEERGFSKTGLVKTLIRDFLEQQHSSTTYKSPNSLETSLVRILNDDENRYDDTIFECSNVNIKGKIKFQK